MASNGTVRLAAWTDGRSGNDSVVASRIDVDGRAMDPLGIHIPGESVEAVMWNGQAFVVATRANPQHLLTAVLDDGSVVESQQLALPPGSLFAATASDRLLYISSRDGDASQFSIVDSTGRVILEHRDLPAPPSGTSQTGCCTAAGGKSEFLLIRSDKNRSDTRLFLTPIRISIDGDILSVRESSFFVLTESFSTMTLVAGTSGYLFVVQRTRGIDIYSLDRSGVPSASRSLPVSGDTYAIGPFVADGDRYFFESASKSAGYFRLLLTEIDSAAAPLVMWESPTSVYPAGMFDNGDGWITFVTRAAAYDRSDLYSQIVRADRSTSQPLLLTHSETLQANAGIAAVPGGNAIAWAERDREDSMAVFVRRFTTSGDSLDSAPIEVGRFGFTPTNPYSNTLPDVEIAANDRVLFIVWNSYAGTYVRRMSHSGQWIDNVPIRLGSSSYLGRAFPVAANSNGALVALETDNDVIICAIPTGGDPFPQKHFDVHAIDIGIATDGGDFLVAIAETYTCNSVSCYPFSLRVLVSRVKSDGTPIDAVPLVLEAGVAARRISAAFNGHYLVSWAVQDQIRAAAISRNGTMTEPATRVEWRSPWGCTDVRLAGAGDGFLLLTKWQFRPSAEWTAITFGRDTPLVALAPLPRQTISRLPSNTWGTAATASAGGLTTIAFDHPDPSAGWVPRVFLQVFWTADRRRAVQR